jgi:flagellar biogenesis protein FliO
MISSIGASEAIRIFLILASILLAIYCLYLLIRKQFSIHKGRNQQRIKLIESRALDPRTSIFLIEVDGVEFILSNGCSAVRISDLRNSGSIANGHNSSTAPMHALERS